MRLRRQVLLLIGLTALALGLASCNPTGTARLETLVTDLLLAGDDPEIQEAMDAIIQADPNPVEVAELLRQGPSSFEALDPGWQIHELACEDGKSRFFHLYVPLTYNPAHPHTLVVGLHGAVVQPGYTIEEFLPRRRMWEASADRDGFLVLMPHGDRDATWWSENGRRNMDDLLRWAKTTCNIDDNRIFLSGFSDGASGTYWMAFHDPTPWAGFIPIYGSIAGPERGPYQCYPANLDHRGILASNGMGENYYRLEQSLIRQLLEQEVELYWTLHPTEHNLAMTMPHEQPRSEEFIRQTTREPFADRIAWRTAHAETGRCDWIAIETIDPGKDESRWQPLNLGWDFEVSHFGAGLQYINPERSFEVVGVEPDTLADWLGVKLGDKIMRIDQIDVLTNADIASVLESKRPGEAITVEVLRQGELLIFEGETAAVFATYRRALPMAAISAQADGNTIIVETQNVRRYRLLLSSAQFDLEQPITVITNGLMSFNAPVDTDLTFMLNQWREDWDRTTVYESSIEVTVP